MREQTQLFVTALLQVTFVSMNVVFISKSMIVPMLITGFLISLIWTLNVKKVAFGRWRDRFIYAFGAMTGTYLGFILSTKLIKLFE